MPNMRIVPYNLHDLAALSTSVASVADFGIENTQNRKRSRIWLSINAADQTISGSLPMDCYASHLSIWRHTAKGADISIEFFSDAAWTTSIIVIGPNPATILGSEPFKWGINNSDPFAGDAGFAAWFDLVGPFQSYRISFAGPPDGAGAYEASRIFLGEAFEPEVNHAFGSTIGINTITDAERSRGGTPYTNGVATWRTMQLDYGEINEANRATFLDIQSWLGRSQDAVISWFPEDGTRLERDHCINGIVSNVNPFGREVSFLTGRFQIEEC